MKKLILASGNAGRLREIQVTFARLGCAVLTHAVLRPLAIAPFGRMGQEEPVRTPDMRHSPGKGLLVE